MGGGQWHGGDGGVAASERNKRKENKLFGSAS